MFCRYLAICVTLGIHLTKRKALLAITFTWMFASAIYSPWLVVYKHELWQDGRTYLCQNTWDKTAQKAFFMGANFLLSYSIPLVLISAFYFLIGRRVWKRKAIGESANEVAIKKSKVKVAKMLLVVVVLFALSWLPLYVIHIRVLFWSWDQRSPDFVVVSRYVYPIVQWLGLANSCVNPLIYCLFSHKFRAGFKLFCCRSQNNGANMQRTTELRPLSNVHANGNTRLTKITSSYRSAKLRNPAPEEVTVALLKKQDDKKGLGPK